MHEQARAAAKGHFAAWPLSRRPFLLKDLTSTFAGADEQRTGSSVICFAPHDSEMVRRFKASGVVILGRRIRPNWA
jgi:Asp-tRNA(Asn)/Glu-tRNA(Gln) amidotransferase A subunit family amidase